MLNRRELFEKGLAAFGAISVSEKVMLADGVEGSVVAAVDADVILVVTIDSQECQLTLEDLKVLKKRVKQVAGNRQWMILPKGVSVEYKRLGA